MDYVRLSLKTLTVYSLTKLATDEDVPAQARTPSHPSRTITTSIEVEEPSQPSCCDRSTTLRSLSSRAGHHALCTSLPVKRLGLTWPAWCLALRGARSLTAPWQIYSRVRSLVLLVNAITCSQS
jgi:hypothetical protein